MIPASDFKRGTCVQVNGEPSIVIDVSFTTPTARGASPIAKTKFRNLKTGKLTTDSIRVSEKFEEVDLENRPCSYLYNDGSKWYFMDSESYEQFELTQDEMGDATGYLKDGIEGLKAMLIDGKVVSVTLPQTVDLEVTQTDPALKGATAKAQMKPATLETGIEVQVPPYLSIGEMIRIDTRTGHFVERVKN